MEHTELNGLAQHAVDLKHNGRNCCQAVVEALAKQEGIQSELLSLMTAGFGVGMGNMEATCGSLVGANMIAGLKTQGRGTIMKSRQLSETFQKKCGAITCKILKGNDTGTVLCPCDDCVRNAVLSYAEVLGL